MNWLQRRVRPEQVREFSLLLLIIVAVLVFGSLIDSYYTARTFNRIASSVAIITIVAVGQTLVVLTRNIDLSVGSLMGLSAVIFGKLWRDAGLPAERRLRRVLRREQRALHGRAADLLHAGRRLRRVSRQQRLHRRRKAGL